MRQHEHKDDRSCSVVYLTDCMDYMAGLPDNALDVCITDPPRMGLI